MQDLKELIEFASKAAEKIFRIFGVIVPLYHTVKPTGEIMIIQPPGLGSKDLDIAWVKAVLALENIERYVFIDEAWVLNGPDLDNINGDLSNHPDRREVVIFAAENRQGEILTAMRFILRPEHGKAILSPLKINDVTDTFSGRMVGLLKG